MRSCGLGPLYGNTSPPGLTDLGGTTHVNILGFGYSFCSRQDKLKLIPGTLRSLVYRIPKTTAYASEFCFRRIRLGIPTAGSSPAFNSKFI